MEIENCWKSFDWFNILSLPTLDWAQPFLSHCKLPRELCANLSSWEAIQRQAREDATAQIRQVDRYRKDSRIIEARIQRKVVSVAFFKLAQIVGTAVARDYERWIRLLFFSPEFENSISAWKSALARAYPPSSSNPARRKRWQDAQISPPPALMPLLPTLAPLVRFQVLEQLLEQVYIAAPKEKVPEWSLKISRKVREEGDRKYLKNLEKAPPERKAELEHFNRIRLENRPPIPEIKPCHEAYLLTQAVGQTLGFEILQILADSLNATERNEVVDWAQRQLLSAFPDRNRGQTLVEQLRGGKYLQSTLPDFEGISVFDLSPEELEV